MPFLRKDVKNCIAIGLSEGSMCDNCKFFKARLNGMAGRKPKKTEEPNCEKIWKQKKLRLKEDYFFRREQRRN